MKSKDIKVGQEYLACRSNTWDSRDADDYPATPDRVRVIAVGGWTREKFAWRDSEIEIDGVTYKGQVRPYPSDRSILVTYDWAPERVHTISATQIRALWESGKATYNAAEAARVQIRSNRLAQAQIRQAAAELVRARARKAGLGVVLVAPDRVTLDRAEFEEKVLPLLERANNPNGVDQ